MAEVIEVSDVISCTPEELYGLWLTSEGHSKLTGSAAKSGSLIGDAFTAWDGYISGKTIGLQPNRRIIQLWRTTEFPEGSPDSCGGAPQKLETTASVWAWVPTA